MKEDLKGFYAEYLKREDVYLQYHKNNLSEQLHVPLKKLKETEDKLEHAKIELSKQEGDNPKAKELVAIEKNIK